ncbi:hypothetical protein V8E54_004330 [Elaphomyces granulatus]
MTRRKRAITASINNLKRAKQFKEDHTQKPVEPEDDGEIVLWNDVLVEESRKKADNKDEDFDHCRLRHPGPHRGHPHLHCSDLRRGIHFFPVLYPLRFVRGPSLGEYFSPRVGRWTAVTADAVGTYTVKGHASLCVMVSYFNNA